MAQDTSFYRISRIELTWDGAWALAVGLQWLGALVCSTNITFVRNPIRYLQVLGALAAFSLVHILAIGGLVASIDLLRFHGTGTRLAWWVGSQVQCMAPFLAFVPGILAVSQDVLWRGSLLLLAAGATCMLRPAFDGGNWWHPSNTFASFLVVLLAVVWSIYACQARNHRA